MIVGSEYSELCVRHESNACAHRAWAYNILLSMKNDDDANTFTSIVMATSYTYVYYIIHVINYFEKYNNKQQATATNTITTQNNDIECCDTRCFEASRIYTATPIKYMTTDIVSRY